MNLSSGNLGGTTIYLVGIKGSGMSALAELLVSEGAEVSGSDVAERFYTDDILEKNSIRVFQGFNPDNVPGKDHKPDFVIYSPAYNPQEHPELLKARELGYEILEYTQALGQYSSSLPMAAVSGIHGKTTTTALIGTMIQNLNLPGTVLVGSAVQNFGGRPTLSNGKDFFIAETCEYRRHFLDFSPANLLITSIEADHLDYFADESDVRQAFVEFMDKLPPGGAVVYCHDDPGARETVESYLADHRDIRGVAYGFSATGSFRLTRFDPLEGRQRFSLEGFSREFVLPYPGEHSLLNASGAIALLSTVLGLQAEEMDQKFGDQLAGALASFSGTTRRSELIGEYDGIRVVDDYAHHPTAVQKTLAGFRELYPESRLLVDFMSHTYSRTAALLDDFARAFSEADVVVLNDIYASAREQNQTGIRGEDLYRALAKNHPRVSYQPSFEKAAEQLLDQARQGDIIITMGAGDNWRVGRLIATQLEEGRVRV